MKKLFIILVIILFCFIVKAPSDPDMICVGANSPGDHDWVMDQVPQPIRNEMLQFTVTAPLDYGIKIEQATISSSGTGNDADIGFVDLWWDINSNGTSNGGIDCKPHTLLSLRQPP